MKREAWSATRVSRLTFRVVMESVGQMDDLIARLKTIEAKIQTLMERL